MSLTIPPRFSTLLHGITDEISSAVGAAFNRVSPILERNESPFFSDYTDHGIQHIDSVLKTCETIISDDAWSVFSREDAATLILATISHDLGMLIDTEGFNYLVEPNSKITPQLELNDAPWPKLWREYQLDTRRFNGAMLIRLLGSPEPVPLHELTPGNFSDRGFKIAGEFLRRNHHRLAHEIVINGMPSPNGPIPLFNESPVHLREIAGLVARSHGVDVRTCLESLIKRDKTAHREYRHIHPTFLMTLVRLADYLDLDHSRAPSSVLSAKSLKSPISRREWWAHKALVDCHSFTDDPECLHVVIETAALPDIETYITIEDKVVGVQQELDACWAVLGEVYGRFPPLNRLCLKIRRIRSDLRQPIIVEQLPFVPHRASLESSKSDLLKLLIAPLYGDDPCIGVRELLQNSIDAVRELEYTLSRFPALSPIEQDDLPGEILINFEHDKVNDWWIVISDLGIGMTWETVRNYYLTAGASFRHSNAWKKQFTDDDSGEAQVLRSGRFGVGILAAFLLGDRVQVSTRNVEEPRERGIYFEFGLDDTTIELKWENRNVGTTVKVKINEKVLKNLTYWPGRDSRNGWDWYCLTNPKVVRINEEAVTLNQQCKFPEAKGVLPDTKHAIQVPGYQEIHWTYDRRHPRLICNGIFVSDYQGLNIESQFTNNEVHRHDRNLILNSPNISVFDPDGRLPLNLARNSLARQPSGIASALADDICRNFIAFCLLRGPAKPILLESLLNSYSVAHYNGYERVSYYNRYSFWYFNFNYGFGLCDPWNIEQLPIEKALLIRAQNNISRINGSITELANLKYDSFWGESSEEKLGDFDRWHRNLLEMNLYPFLYNLNVKGIRSIMPRKWFLRLAENQPKTIFQNVTIQEETEKWIIWTAGNYTDSDETLLLIADEFQKKAIHFESLTECAVISPKENLPQGRIAKVWEQAVGGPIIPFDKNNRIKIIDSLGEEYNRHLAQWFVK